MVNFHFHKASYRRLIFYLGEGEGGGAGGTGGGGEARLVLMESLFIQIFEHNYIQRRFITPSGLASNVLVFFKN